MKALSCLATVQMACKGVSSDRLVLCKVHSMKLSQPVLGWGLHGMRRM